MLAKMVPSLWTDLKVLMTLLVVLLASAGTFWALVRRWESHRQWMAIADWGREHGYRSHPLDPARLPPPLDRLSDQNPLVRVSMADDMTRLLQVQTALAHQPDESPRLGGEIVWNLLIRRLNSTWEPTGLRPSSPLPSVLDLFSLSSFPLLGTTERFMIFGTDTDAATALSASMTRSLLPPDIGLLLHGDQLVLDFSQRPFDEIEFNRMIALINQVAGKLPPRNI